MDCFYMVVSVDQDGMFLEEPQTFDTKSEAFKRHKELSELHPDIEFVVFECNEIRPK